MPKKAKRATPPELDFIFDRDLISEDDYGEFWKEWFSSNQRGKQDIIDRYLEESGSKTEKGETELPLKGIITKDKKVAQNQARSINGFVVRRNRTGKFDKRGHFYQAVRRGKKEKQKGRVSKKKSKR